jgi:Rrf2 family protein
MVEQHSMISRTAEYALRAVVALGSNPGGPRTTQQIAKQTQVPLGYLAKVLQSLSRAGLVVSQRGINGGFVLARPLEDLTVLDVINAVDPLKRIERCPLGLAVHGNRLCPLHRRLDQGIAQLEALFGATTIGQLLAEEESNLPFCEGAGCVATTPSQPDKLLK